MPVINNKKYGKAIIRVTNASETISLANLQIAGETVRGAHITEVYWTGPATIIRNGVTILNLTDGQDNWIFDGDFTLREQANSSIDITVAAGTVLLEVNKITEDEQ